MKYTRGQLDAIMVVAFAAGRDAARRKLDELRAAGPAFTVHDTGLFGRPSADNIVGTMLDVCGNAGLEVSGKSATHRALRVYLDRTVELPGGGRVYYRPSWPTGFHFDIFDMTGRQEMSVNEAAIRAVKRVLDEHGLDGTRVSTRID